MKNIVIVLLLLAIILTGCMPDSDHAVVGTSVANLYRVWETQYPGMAITPSETVPPTSTNTRTPTVTITPTRTLTPTRTSTTVPTQTGVYHVYPGQSLQAAINKLAAGNTLYVHAGTYSEKITVGVSNVTIIGDQAIVDYVDVGYWGVLFRISGSYVTISGFEVRNSDYMGVILSGSNISLSNFNVHHSLENGILITGDNNLVENSRVWQNCRSNVNGSRTRGGWASGLSAARRPNNAIIRNNQVYQNWGEGLSTYEASGTLIEGNEVFDNYVNLYVSDAQNVIVRNNHVYIPTNPVVMVGSRVGIMLGDEKYNPASSNIQILDNVVENTYRNLYWWQGTQGGGMNNVVIEGNTFTNSQYFAGVQINSAPHVGVVFEGNTTRQTNGIQDAYIGNCNQVLFTGNTWTGSAPCVER